MHLLQAGFDMSVIALWLIHESTLTTHMYVEADLQLKRKSLRKLASPLGAAYRFKPGDRLLAFLERL